MPIKPAGVDFKKDIRRLKKCSQDVKATMLKVKLERANSTTYDANVNNYVNDMKDEISGYNTQVNSGSGFPMSQ